MISCSRPEILTCGRVMALNIRPTIRPTFRPIPISSRPGPRHKALEAVCFLVILLSIIQGANPQLVTTSDETSKEGDAEVVITCDYSQFNSTTPDEIQWDELSDDGSTNLVNDKKIQHGRFKLNITLGKADLMMSQPMRNDSGRRFQCEIQTTNGDIKSSNPSILTVYYLDQPLFIASASTVYEGQSVTFTCSKPDGDPIPHITWYKDGQTVNNPSRYEIANSSTESVLNIKSATEEDGGRYTCKAESDQFKGQDAKTSVGKNLIVHYITVTFTSEDGIATCTAEGYPKPLSVLILQDGEVVKKGENTATIEINEEICQSSLTCYAENGKLNDTTTLGNCDTGAGSFILIFLIVVVVVGLFLWLLFLVYFMYCKNIEWSNKDTVTVEGGELVEMSFKYRPSIARFKTFGIKKEEKVIGSNQQQFSSWKTVCQFICYCCAYFCGFCCIEYCLKSFEYNSKDKKKHSSGSRSGEEIRMNGSEREDPDGADVPLVDTSALPKSGETSETNPVDEGSELLAEHQETSVSCVWLGGLCSFLWHSRYRDRVSPWETKSKTSYSMSTSGRGRISLTVSNPVRSDSGEYNCSIEGSRQQYPGVNNLSFYSAADYEHDNTYRRPAVVFINSHVLVFVEKNNSDVILKRGKMNIKSLIEWEESRVILHEEDTSFQNLVPIVTHNRKVILMCVKQNKNTKDWKTIKIETDDYGDNWKEPFYVNFPSKIEEVTSLLCIDGVCLESGNLVLAGVCNIDNNGSKERSLLVIISTDDGDNCNIEHVIKLQVTSGIHTQVVEYGQDQVYIICTLEDDSTHLFIINSKDGCKTVDVVNEKEETNLECQSGIVFLPTKTDEFYQVAVTSHGNETNKDLTLYLSKDGCKTWSQLYTLGAVNAEESDLAYYSVKEGEEEAEGIVCVYNYGSETKGYNIEMQLISKKEIKQTEI